MSETITKRVQPFCLFVESRDSLILDVYLCFIAKKKLKKDVKKIVNHFIKSKIHSRNPEIL